MKRLLVLFLTAFSLLLVAADYELILLGDLHYDGPQYRRGATGVKQSRKQEFARNAGYWARNIPEVLNAAGDKVSPNTRYVIQLGDIVQGDAVSDAMHQKMIGDALGIVCPHFGTVPVLLTKGNHDIRTIDLNGFNAAYKSFVLPYLKEKLKLDKAPEDMNYAVRIGDDLLLFIDSINPDLPRIEAEIDRNPGFKRLLVFTHVPVLPCPGAHIVCNYTPGGAGLAAQANIQPENRKRLLELLVKHNAYIFCGHTHAPAIVEWKSEKGRIIQLTSSSMAKEGGSPGFTLRLAGKAALGKSLQNKDLTGALEDYVNPVRFFEVWNGWGFVVLRISDDAIVADLYSGNGKKPEKTVVLSQPMPEKIVTANPVPAETH